MHTKISKKGKKKRKQASKAKQSKATETKYNNNNTPFFSLLPLLLFLRPPPPPPAFFVATTFMCKACMPRVNPPFLPAYSRLVQNAIANALPSSAPSLCSPAQRNFVFFFFFFSSSHTICPFFVFRGTFFFFPGFGQGFNPGLSLSPCPKPVPHAPKEPKIITPKKAYRFSLYPGYTRGYVTG
jgi:hypothetical protein